MARHAALFGCLLPELLEGPSQGPDADRGVLVQGVGYLLKLRLAQRDREIIEEREESLVLGIGVLVQSEPANMFLGLACVLDKLEDSWLFVRLRSIWKCSTGACINLGVDRRSEDRGSISLN